MKIGIDKISFHVPNYYLDMAELANARDTDPDKFHIGLGQDKMSVIPKTQDIVTLGASAAKKILSDEDKQTIDMVIVGTESGIDFSKSSAVIIHRLLGIQPFARSFEIKHACYGGTAAIQQAYNYIACHPQRKVLVITTDIAKYGLKTAGEPTQGCGAVAMLISADPCLLTFMNDSVFYSEDIYDFWRPVGHHYPLVDGQLSNEVYINSFVKVWKQNLKQNQLQPSDYIALTFHLPYTKMGKKALKAIFPEISENDQERFQHYYEQSTIYSRQTGNLYTGSLYLGLISLLDNSQTLQAGDRIGLFSYGSGAVSEFFSMELVEGYEKYLMTNEHQALLDNRQSLSITDYEKIFEDVLPQDENEYLFNDTTLFAIQKMMGNIRYYKIDD
ncbi:hydroxymethylglutaryl-CoA synthase [Melissococcus plutonius]|uniref:Hydroxymethylglutaryl-CoA synthase n=1 Tax=Melissococcus plutonius (strain ATCC 35311 / DSM 29964 / CIP 104052 / LMG 20360 / NCIMB 702443) TaxID=940190 RepID=F3YCT5_MELPT|nr:hydroxymethylglutaryl-CoA synthase [Melissococcus plutonius]AIM26046.1 hydroxymethylglutaryl-CoA synthase [Melissococcus plutonius S1]KMT23508.1 hydroxymethylglutaryl-CoA synthase [Melissococcus plutonius]KMT23682.1 hydroxymethylglutaryl-CoA synthase [Melissococcus plutonius]KMT23789.1 hydroxymethylglutaryl-CoA synthase [Melissococcus plutonius]KMT28142.1 hydroxymethylglutaryl-CoA synthase [Melissococcus plutonius]